MEQTQQDWLYIDTKYCYSADSLATVSIGVETVKPTF